MVGRSEFKPWSQPGLVARRKMRGDGQRRVGGAEELIALPTCSYFILWGRLSTATEFSSVVARSGHDSVAADTAKPIPVGVSHRLQFGWLDLPKM